MRDRNTPCGRKKVIFETFFIHARYEYFLDLHLHIYYDTHAHSCVWDTEPCIQVARYKVRRIFVQLQIS